MEKRHFLKSIATLGLGLPLLSFNNLDWAIQLDKAPKLDVTADEDFWQLIRKEYRLKPDYIHLESGYYNMVPEPTLNALIDHIRMVNFENSYYMRTIQWDNKKAMVEELSEVIGCSPNELIITRNTTESLDMIIKGFPWQKGDEAVYALQDYGAMQDMFQQVSKQHGIELKVVSVPNHPKDDDELVALYENAITGRTRLLMVCHMINITGQILPIKKICDMAHRKGVQVMVDGAHCIGHFEFNIEDLNCDYYGSSLHKWLAAPLGTGMLYIKKEHQESIWPLFAEHEGANGIERLNHTGTHPVYHDLSIRNAMAYYTKLGGERKEKRLRYLQNYWTDKVRNHAKIKVNTPEESERACAIANVGIEGLPPLEMSKRLFKEHGIWTVAIDTANVQGCRITPNVFTTTEELDVLIKGLYHLAS